jgi:hypothetical protein
VMKQHPGAPYLNPEYAPDLAGGEIADKDA